MATAEELRRYEAQSVFRQNLMTGLVDDAVAQHPELLEADPLLGQRFNRYINALTRLDEVFSNKAEAHGELGWVNNYFFGQGENPEEGHLASAGLSMVVVARDGLTVYKDIPEQDRPVIDDRPVQFCGGTQYGGYAYTIRGRAPGEFSPDALVTHLGTLILLKDISRAMVCPGLIRSTKAAEIILARKELAACFDDDHIKAFRVHPSRYEPEIASCSTCTVSNCRHR